MDDVNTCKTAIKGTMVALYKHGLMGKNGLNPASKTNNRANTY